MVAWGLILLAVVAVGAAAAVAAAVTGAVARRRWRDELDRAAPTDGCAGLVGRRDRARARFAELVAAHEQAAARSATARVGGGDSGGGDSGGGDSGDRGGGGGVGTGGEVAAGGAAAGALDEARSRLFDAERALRACREEGRPSPPPPLRCWIAAGRLGGWIAGPVGVERAVLRVEHLLDPSCWAVYELRRLRLGLGLGGERSDVAGFVIGAALPELPDLLADGFAGGEVALRPGFSPVRLVRSRSRRGPARRAVRRLLRAARRDGPASPVADGARDAAIHAFSVELGQDLRAGAAPRVTPTVLSLHAGGPALVVGAWAGRRPRTRLLASSGQPGWTPAPHAG